MAKVVDYLDKYYNNETNYNCAEAVFSAAMDAWGVEMPPETVKAMAGFGGGMGCGNICSEDCIRLKPQFFKPEIRCRQTIEQVAGILDQVYEMDR